MVIIVFGVVVAVAVVVAAVVVVADVWHVKHEVQIASS